MVNEARKSGYIFQYRLTILGSEKVGKTSIVDRFINNTFTHRYRPTIEDHRTHVIDHSGNMCVCLFTDTSGSNDFPAMKRLAIKKGNAFLIVYSINDKRSFKEAKRILNEVQRVKPANEADDDLKIILIANKSDLESEREIRYNEGCDMVADLNEKNIQSSFFEVSAKDGKNVDLTFVTLLDMFSPKSDSLETEVTPPLEKLSFRRLSIKRKKKKENANEREQIRLGVRKSLCHSDSKLCEMDFSSSSSMIKTQKSTTDSDSEHSDSEKFSHIDRERIGSSALDLLKSKFGSIHKLFKAESSPKLKRRTNGLPNDMVS